MRNPDAVRPHRRALIAVAIAVVALSSFGVAASLGGGSHTTGTLLVGDGASPAVAAATGPALAVPVAVPAVGPLAALFGSFSIAGGVEGLYPGDSTPLVLTVTNPQDFAITVQSIVTLVGGAARSCGADNVAVATFHGALIIGPKKSAEATVRVVFAHSAPNGCEGERFPFVYFGLASRS